jgi:hypothetical protein
VISLNTLNKTEEYIIEAQNGKRVKLPEGNTTHRLKRSL